MTVVCAAPLFNGTFFPSALILSDSRVTFLNGRQSPRDDVRKLHILGENSAVGIVGHVDRARAALADALEQLQVNRDRSFWQLERLLRWAATKRGTPTNKVQFFYFVLVGIEHGVSMTSMIQSRETVDIKGPPDFVHVAGDPSVVKTVRPEIGLERMSIQPSGNAPPWMNEKIRFEAAMNACVVAAQERAIDGRATVGGPIQTVLLRLGQPPLVRQLALVNDPGAPTAGLIELDSESFSLGEANA